jgi:hypothetical protein
MAREEDGPRRAEPVNKFFPGSPLCSGIDALNYALSKTPNRALGKSTQPVCENDLPCLPEKPHF